MVYHVQRAILGDPLRGQIHRNHPGLRVFVHDTRLRLLRSLDKIGKSKRLAAGQNRLLVLICADDKIFILSAKPDCFRGRIAPAAQVDHNLSLYRACRPDRRINRGKRRIKRTSVCVRPIRRHI